MAIAGRIIHNSVNGIGYLAKPPPTGGGTTARQADTIADFFGVVFHIGDVDYENNWTLIVNALSVFPVRHIRSRQYNGTQGNVMKTKQIALNAAYGVKFGGPVGTPNYNAGNSPAALVDFYETYPAGILEYLEGCNEWNLHGGVDTWDEEARAHHALVYAEVKGSAVAHINSLPVISPSVGGRQGYSTLGDIGSLCDYGNIHCYMSGLTPSVRIDTAVIQQHIVTPHAPAFVTETGYTNAMNLTTTKTPTTEKATGIYMLRLLLEFYSRSVHNGHAEGLYRVYPYEFYDEKNDPGLTDDEAHFGLIRHDGTFKPSFLALQRFLNLIKDPGATFTTSGLLFEVAGPADLRSLVFQKRDGRHYLVLWRDVSVYNNVTETDIVPAEAHVSVNLGYLSQVNTYVNFSGPASGAGAYANSSTTGTSVGLDMRGEAVVLEITRLG